MTFNGALRNNKKHPFYALGIKIDNNGILKCMVRPSTANLSESTKFAILLPSRSDATDLIILESHNRLLHAGVSHTLTGVRQMFWVPIGHAGVKRIIKLYNKCKRFQGGTFPLPPMLALPKERTEQARPFQNTDADYWDP